MATQIWTSDRRLYLDKAGAVVEAADPTKATLLVPAGGTLPLEQARALGLVAEPAPAAEPKGKPAPANKARTPKETKGKPAADDASADGEGDPA